MTNFLADKEGGQTAVFRILDATSNRGREAIRVIEDVVRFIYEDPEITTALKALRHDFTSIVKQFPLNQLLASRATDSDIGTGITGEGEYFRQSLDEVLAANFSRLQESLRSIEELSKMVSPKVSPEMEQLRYSSYTLEQMVMAKLTEHQKRDVRRVRHESLFKSMLYVLLDTSVSDGNLLKLVESGVDMIQLRDKTASDRLILETGRRWRKLISITPVQVKKPLLIMNDRPDLAVLTDFDGVHVGQNELPIAEVRHIVGEDLLVGLSTHNMNDVRHAIDDHVDYIGAGPVFPSETKTFSEYPGLPFLEEIVRLHPVFPVFAIGGINTENVSQVFQTGCFRVAVSAAVTQSEDGSQEAGRLRLLMDSNLNRPSK